MESKRAFGNEMRYKHTGWPYLPKHIFKDGAKWLMVPSKTVLASLSVWPESQNYVTLLLHILCWFSYAFLMVGSIYYIYHSRDLGDIIYAASILVVSIETAGRRILCYVYRGLLTKILHKVYFKFWPSTMLGEELHKEISSNSSDLYIVWAVELFMAFLCGVQYIILPIFSNNTPLRTAYPFPLRGSPYYELIYIWQSFLSLELVFNICGLDLLLISLLMNCIAQFKLLKTFLPLELKKILLEPSGYDKKKAMKVVLTCIHHHDKLISTCREIDQAFTIFILIQFLTSIATVCLSGFTATVVNDVVGNSITYMGGHVSEILIYCYMGNELSFQSTQLSDAAFECGWHCSHGDRDLQKTLMMVMVRAQRPIRMSAGGFGYLTLQTFMKLIQFSFSVFTLLIKMENKRNV